MFPQSYTTILSEQCGCSSEDKLKVFQNCLGDMTVYKRAVSVSSVVCVFKLTDCFIFPRKHVAAGCFWIIQLYVSVTYPLE